MYSAGICVFKVSNGNTRTFCEICSNLTMKTQKQCQWRCYGILIVKFEQISTYCFGVSIVDFEQVNAEWVTVWKV